MATGSISCVLLLVQCVPKTHYSSRSDTGVMCSHSIRLSHTHRVCVSCVLAPSGDVHTPSVCVCVVFWLHQVTYTHRVCVCPLCVGFMLVPWGTPASCHTFFSMVLTACRQGSFFRKHIEVFYERVCLCVCVCVCQWAEQRTLHHHSEEPRLLASV